MCICTYRESEVCSVEAQQADDYCILYCIHDPHCEGRWLQINVLLTRRVSLYVLACMIFGMILCRADVSMNVWNAYVWVFENEFGRKISVQDAVEDDR